MKRQNRDEDEGVKKILACRLELAEALHGLTLNQKEAIRSEDWDGLKTILDEKDQRIHQFRETEKHLKRWTPLNGLAERAPALKTVLSKIESTLVTLQSMEAECRGLMTERKKQTVETLRGLKKARDGIRRFKPSRSRTPRFVDLHK